MKDKRKITIYIALSLLIIAVIVSVIIISRNSSGSASDTILVPYEETTESTETESESETITETTTEKQTTTVEETAETSTEPEATTETETTTVAIPEVSQLLNEKKRLSKGSTGENVYVLQEILIALKYMSGKTTGTFDDSTYDAVVAFQQDNSIVASGIVTSKTAKALNSKVKVNEKLTTSTTETTTQKETTTKEKETTTQKQTTTEEITENNNYDDSYYDNYDYNYDYSNNSNSYNDDYSSYTEPATTAHTHSYSVQSSAAATCTSQGYTTYVCSCGASYTDTTPAFGHNWVAHTTSVKVIDQAAEAPQYQTSYYCNGCGQQIGLFVPDTSHFSYCPAGGTSYSEQSVLISAGTSEVSHYEDQIDYYYCSTCGATK